MKAENKFVAKDWITAEDEFAQVVNIVEQYYEPFDKETDEEGCKMGDHKQTLIAYRPFCTHKGRILHGKTRIVYLESCNWIHPLTPADKELLEDILKQKPTQFARWLSQQKPAEDYITIYVKTEEGKAQASMRALRKVAKNLPDRFTFSVLATCMQDTLSLDISVISNCRPDGSYFEFTLLYRLEEQQGKETLFFKIGKWDYTEPKKDEDTLASIFTFEMVFISMAQLVNRYRQKHPSPNLDALMDALHDTWKALYHHDWEKSPLAKDFFDHAPKKCITLTWLIQLSVYSYPDMQKNCKSSISPD